MSTWDFDFTATDSFITPEFCDADPMFISGSLDIPLDENSVLPIKPLTEINTSTTDSEDDIHLNSFFSSLGQSADKLQDLQKNLKGQLDDCRNWFKSAVFTGLASKNEN